MQTHVVGPVGTCVCLVFSRGNSGGDIEAKLERAAVAPEADLIQTSEADLPQADLPLVQPEADKYRKSETHPDSLPVEKDRNCYSWPSETLSSEKSLSPNPTRVSAAQLLQILESDDPLQVLFHRTHTRCRAKTRARARARALSLSLSHARTHMHTHTHTVRSPVQTHLKMPKEHVPMHACTHTL
jgi:hypothetical protein